MLFGDCTGNWRPSAGSAAAATGVGAAAAHLRPIADRQGRSVVELRLEAPASFGGAEVKIDYDPAALRLHRVRRIQRALLQVAEPVPGHLGVALAGRGVLHAGGLLRLSFDRLDERRAGALRIGVLHVTPAE